MQTSSIKEHRKKLDKIINWCVEVKWRLFIAVQIFVFLAALLGYIWKVNHLTEFHFSQEQIESFSPEMNSAYIGGTIDESFPSGLYDVIPDIRLPKGYYRYTVGFESSSEGSFCWPHSYVDFYNVIEQAVTYMPNDGIRHENTDEFWVNAELDVTLRLLYTGNGSASVNSFSIYETDTLPRLELFYAIIFLVAVNLIVIGKKYVKADQDKFIFFGLAATFIVASYPLFLPYAIRGHDFDFHLVRIESLKTGLLSGQFPVRLSPDFYNGYGYANSIFYGETLLYIPALLRLVGFSLTTSYNLFVMLINLLTCIGGYWCFSKIFGNKGIALALAFLYTMSPYRLMDVYLRTAVGEYSAMAFLPFVVYGMYRIYTEDTKSPKYPLSFLPLVIGLTGIIQTHVLTGLITAAAIFLACILLLIRTLQRKRLWALFKAALITIGVNAWFLVPFIDFYITQDVRSIRAPSTASIQKTGVFWTQLMGMFYKYQWYDKPAAEGMTTEMPLTLGIAFVLGMLLCFVMLFIVKKEIGKVRRQGAIFLILSVILTWMSTISFPWDRISTSFPQIPKIATFISSLQFAWRFLSVATVLAAVATGFGLLFLCRNNGRQAFSHAAIVLCLLTGISGMFFMQEALTQQPPVILNNIKSINTTYAATGGEYVLCESRHEVVTEITEPRIYGDISVADYEKFGTNITFTVSSQTEGYILLPLHAYKGYRVTSDDGTINNENLKFGEAAVIQIDIPAGYSGNISVEYSGLWYWRAAEFLSLMAMAGILILFFTHRKRKLVLGSNELDES